MKPAPSNFEIAREMYGRGLSFRQIGYRLDMLPTAIKARAKGENWPLLAPVDWHRCRMLFMAGNSMGEIAAKVGVSLSTLKKRKLRENWCRDQPSGLFSLRFAVQKLETALDSTAPDDATSIARLSAALSIAAARLARSEKGEGAASSEPAPDACDEEQAKAELTRLLGEG
jgi:uncharacterized protein YjcR